MTTRPTAGTSRVQEDEAVVTVAKSLREEKIPLFYGNPEVDTIDAITYLQRCENAKDVNKWNDALICDNFVNSMRGPASVWGQALKREYGENKVWALWKAEFRTDFVAAIQKDKTFEVLKTLKQKKKENPNLFNARVSQYFDEYQETKNLMTPIMPATYAEEDNHTKRAFADGWTRAMTLAQEKQAMDFFLVGLQEDIREALFDQRLVTDEITRKDLAREANKIYGRKNNIDGSARAATAAAIWDFADDDTPVQPSQTISPVEAEMKALKEEIAALKFQKGGNSGKKNFKCYYCDKPGHTQVECHKRKRENGACKTKDGKSYYPGSKSNGGSHNIRQGFQ